MGEKDGGEVTLTPNGGTSGMRQSLKGGENIRIVRKREISITQLLPNRERMRKSDCLQKSQSEKQLPKHKEVCIEERQ